jgi:hypothetical protein
MDADEPATLTGFLDSSAPLRCKRDGLTPTDSTSASTAAWPGFEVAKGNGLSVAAPVWPLAFGLPRVLRHE